MNNSITAAIPDSEIISGTIPYWVISDDDRAWLHPDAGIDRLSQADELWDKVDGEWQLIGYETFSQVHTPERAKHDFSKYPEPF